MIHVTLKSKSPEDTVKLGVALAKFIKPGDIVCLSGELGAGKTTLVKGIARGLKVNPARVNSPTFVLMKRFPLGASAKKAGFKYAYHIDAYRFRASKESDMLGLKETFKDPRAILLVEWPERLKGLLPKGKLGVFFRHGKREGERDIIAP